MWIISRFYLLDFLLIVWERIYWSVFYQLFEWIFRVLQTLNNCKMRLGCRKSVAYLSSINRLKIINVHLTNLSSVPTLLTLNLPVFKVLSCLSCCSKNLYFFKNFLKILFQKLSKINGLKELILIFMINFFIFNIRKSI